MSRTIFNGVEMLFDSTGCRSFPESV